MNLYEFVVLCFKHSLMFCYCLKKGDVMLFLCYLHEVLKDMFFRVISLNMSNTLSFVCLHHTLSGILWNITIRTTV